MSPKIIDSILNTTLEECLLLDRYPNLNMELADFIHVK